MFAVRSVAFFACFSLFASLVACGGAPIEEVEPSSGGEQGDAGPKDDTAPEDDADASPPDPCATTTCPSHATCTVVDGAATCPCDTGYLAWKDACSPDADEDGLSEDEELELAKELAPVLIFDEDEKLSARRTYFAVAPTADGGRSVYYAHGYFEDGGATLGITKHVGDSEFVVVTRKSTGETSLFLSAHYEASSDASAWHPLSKFEKAWVDGRERPVVFVALRKHANYVDIASCEKAAYTLDTCSRGSSELVPVLADRNLGQSTAPLIDEVVLDGRREWFWTDVPFCGWKVDGDQTADRKDCTPPANSYGRQLRAWETNTL